MDHPGMTEGQNVNNISSSALLRFDIHALLLPEEFK